MKSNLEIKIQNSNLKLEFETQSRNSKLEFETRSQNARSNPENEIEIRKWKLKLEKVPTSGFFLKTICAPL